jgi:hemerythrin-like metal-binding protein
MNKPRIDLPQDLETGIHDIDAQHQVLLELVTDLTETSDESRDRTFFERTISYLKNYIAFHFACEEMVMQTYGYPNLPAHRRQHAAFSNSLAKLAVEGAQGPTKKLLVELSFFAEDLWHQHVRVVDREMATFLRRHSPGGEVALPTVRALAEGSYLPSDFDQNVLQGKHGVR